MESPAKQRRANEITVKAQDGAGKPMRFRVTEFEARVIQTGSPPTSPNSRSRHSVFTLSRS